MKRFLGIMQFLTRIPIKTNLGFDEEFHKGMIYFPLVGLILGILYYSITYISNIVFGTYIASVVLLIAHVILTGGLHLDGVGDTFDGIYSYRDKEKILEIMKDSRLGTNALLAIVFLILLKLGFVFAILSENNYYPVILAPVFGRLAIVFACYKNKSPREKGMGNVFINKIGEKEIFIALIYTIFFIACIGFFFKFPGYYVFFLHSLFLMILWILVRCYTKYITGIIGGITGDILGCICELTELLYFIFIYLGGYRW